VTVLHAEPAASIARLGFRKWYERQLIDSHLALVTCVLAMMLAAACLEAFTFPAPATALATLLLAFGTACYVAWLGWRRYRRVMLLAWRFGEAAVCAQCQTYGRFSVYASNGAGATDETVWLDVTCKKCGFSWRMPT
jgi:hypothetical protein